MHDGATAQPEDLYTLLCVRADGVASVVDLVPAPDLKAVRRRAETLLKEHGSAAQVEIWRDGALVDQLERV